MAINSRAFDGRGFCLQQGFCVQGCKMGAKWSTLYTEIPRAEATGKLELCAWSARQRGSSTGRRTCQRGCLQDSEGKEHRQRARLACVAGNAIETARLLLLSSSTKFPQGLANSSGTSAEIIAITLQVLSGEFSTSQFIPGEAPRWRELSRTRWSTSRNGLCWRIPD